MADDRTIRQSPFPAVLEPPPPPLAKRFRYPDSGGDFLPENRLEAKAVVNLRIAFQHHLTWAPNLVVEGGMFILVVYRAVGYAQEAVDYLLGKEEVDAAPELA